ncbi:MULTISPECIES: low affinity iron permease family protein [Niastella]|nr:low affinity iron permease family protein [Niastella soli]
MEKKTKATHKPLMERLASVTTQATGSTGAILIAMGIVIIWGIC